MPASSIPPPRRSRARCNARARLDQAAPDREQVSEPTEPHAQALLDLYIAGFEYADTAALERALRTDVAIEQSEPAPGSPAG